MVFEKERDFEDALIEVLGTKGWEKTVLEYYTEEMLIQNWANILFENNRTVDRLNDYPLTDGEMQQILEQIQTLRTPLRLNGFINGKTVTIKRDNPDDKEHLGKEISLKIYDRHEIAAGQSRYQIVRQPVFPAKSKILNDRRGDLMLLINGMPVIHIELKRTGVDVSQATTQIEKYAHEGVFTGLFSLVQIFVAMNPDETKYFANPGPEGVFNDNYYFHWANFDNEPINDWQKIGATLLSIPMAHQLIGFYTVADGSDGVLKVMRSYQYYAANAISDKVAKTKWEGKNQRGGFIWHTTGSGKTMTSFKSAQLIASSKDADKVIFLVDRIELGKQSLEEYQGFAEENESVQATENTGVLVTKLKSNDPANTMIVTSIQKMSNIKDENEGGLKAADIELMNTKRIVFIIDECHRSTFGEMLLTIKETFPRAIFFGFTGTPIHDENQKKLSTTSTVFGDELHRYSIADGIRDKNVLGFDPYKCMTYKDKDLREVVALEKSKSKDVDEALADSKRAEIYYRYMNDVSMAGYKDNSGKYVKGIEDHVSNAQYQRKAHRDMVMQDVLENWPTVSHGKKFHAILATSSIAEAIDYYKLFKEEALPLRVTALFDPSIDNNPGAIKKEDGLKEIIEDYNKLYGQDFTIPTYGKMKADIANRLAHKKPYERIDKESDKQIDLLIVVDQMLTGYDSKWINALYLDKMLEYESVIQAFSRTNRLFGPEKPFGTIKYYRRPHTMERNIADAVKLYSGDKPFGLFAERLNKNLERMNYLFEQMTDLFKNAEIENFEKLPDEKSERRQFAKLFQEFNEYLEAAKVQGFNWKQSHYEFPDEDSGEKKSIDVLIDLRTFQILALRYKELFAGGGDGGDDGDVPYEIKGYLTTINTGAINAEYMNSRFEKYMKLLQQDGATEEAIKSAEDELHATFASLTQEEQKFANLFLHDIQTGDANVEPGKTLRDYITEYLSRAKDDQVYRLSKALGLDEGMLRELMKQGITEKNINEYGRLDALKETMDIQVAKEYFERIEGKKMAIPMVNIKADKLIREFIIQGGIDIN